MKQLLPLTVLCLALPVSANKAEPQADPLDSFTRAWRDDPVWHDGQAEVAEYEATRTIYGAERKYTARIMTNKEHLSPDTWTKSSGSNGIPVFKLHVREDVPTEAYTYHYSTMCYVGVDDLQSYKIDMGSQEDCGATFKQFIQRDGELSWRQFSYFPGEGGHQQTNEKERPSTFENALPLILRGFPFDQPGQPRFDLLPNQTSTHLTPVDTGRFMIERVGKQTLELPHGRVEAYHLRVVYDGTKGFPGPELAVREYWFAADPGLQHIMVKYEGPAPGGGRVTYALKSVERRAYWIR